MKPEAYKMKTRSRKGMIEAIIDMTERRSYHNSYLLCFNVKCHDADLDLSNLLAKWRECEGNQPYTHNLTWLRAVKERYDQVKDQLFGWGIEDARMQFDEGNMFHTLYDGTELSVEYAFVGRSGGWLAITRFEEHPFNLKGTNLEETLAEMEYNQLKELYQLILIIKDTTKRSKIKEEVEYQAAFNFFANACADIPQSNETQGLLFEALTEEEILID